MFLVRLGLRNLVRNLRRTLLTTTVIVAGVGVLILGQGFIGGLDENVIKATEDGLVGHVLARPADYPEAGIQHPVDALLAITPAARKLLDEGSVAWTERTIFAPTAIAGEDSLRLRAIGFDPARDEAVFPRTTWKVDGEMPGDDAEEVLLAVSAARLLEAKRGDRLVFQLRTHNGAVNALAVTVSGLVSTSNGAIDQLGVFVPAKLARRLVDSDQPSHVSARLGHRDDAPAFRDRLATALGKQAQVVTWFDEAEDLLRLQQIRRKSLNALVFVLLALAAFGIANTILMAAHERVREIGMLRAMGMTAPSVRKMFVIEGGLMGALGGLLGAAWGGGLTAWWARNPIDLTQAMKNQGDFQFSAYLYLAFEPGMIAGAVFFAVLVAVLASVYPARVAARMPPAEAVRAS